MLGLGNSNALGLTAGLLGSQSDPSLASIGNTLLGARNAIGNPTQGNPGSQAAVNPSQRPPLHTPARFNPPPVQMNADQMKAVLARNMMARGMQFNNNQFNS